MLRTYTWHPRVWRTFQKFYIRCTMKGVVCPLFVWFLWLSFGDFWNCRWKFTTGPTVVIMTWDPIAKSWTRNGGPQGLPKLHPLSYIPFIRCSFGLKTPIITAKQRKMPLLYGRQRNDVCPRWPAMHTTLRSSHTFHVIIFCHLTLDCEIGRASIADSGCDCFKTKSSLPIPVMHLGFQSRWISFHQPATHYPLEVDYRFTSGHCTSPSCYSFSFPYCCPGKDTSHYRYVHYVRLEKESMLIQQPIFVDFLRDFIPGMSWLRCLSLTL